MFQTFHCSNFTNFRSGSIVSTSAQWRKESVTILEKAEDEEEENVHPPAAPATPAGKNVTRLSTIVEILKIWNKIFNNKNSINCILLH